MRAGGVMLIAVGVLLLTGWWAEAVTWLQIHLVGTDGDARMSDAHC